MQITAYCFLPGVIFEPLPTRFPIKDGVAWIGNDYEPSPNLSISGPELRGCFLSYASPADIAEFTRISDDPSDPTHKAQSDQIGKLLDKYRGELSEVATILEGLVSLMVLKPMPAFQVLHVNTRLTPENPQDERMIKEEKVIHTCGDIGKVHQDPMIRINKADDMFVHLPKAEVRASALSIYALAVRAEERFELEIAYANFFRIIEGYLGDGTKDVEAALMKKSKEIQTLLKPSVEFVEGLKAILSNLKLPSKAKDENDADGIVKDLVLIRHKLMHYNVTNQDRHFYTALRVDLKSITRNVHRAAFFLLREDVEERIIPE